jgi:hypothetical protein
MSFRAIATGLDDRCMDDKEWKPGSGMLYCRWVGAHRIDRALDSTKLL